MASIQPYTADSSIDSLWNWKALFQKEEISVVLGS